MKDRFSDLKKIPAEPAKRILAAVNLKLKTPVEAPASAPVSEVLAELDAKAAWVDMLMLLAAALPPREAVWWGCLAARDILGETGKSACLAAAEAWVFDPKDDKRAKVQAVVDLGDRDDVAAHCATAALYAPGNMGTGEMAEHPAPPGIVAASVFAMNIEAIKKQPDPMGHLKHLIDRALDIARGGNGRIAPAEPVAEGEAG